MMTTKYDRHGHSRRIFGVNNFTVRNSPCKGQGLFAARDLAINNTVLIIEPPLIVALDIPRLRDTCYTCHFWKEKKVANGGYVDVGGDDQDEYGNAGQKKLLVCGGCKVVRFCGKPCQAVSWKRFHKYECPIYTKLAPKVLPNTVRAVLRMLLLRKARVLPNEIWDDYDGLQSHQTELRQSGGERWENLCLMAKAAKEYSGWSGVDQETVLKMVCQLATNSFTFMTDTYDPIGLALDPITARINHSCKYNATVRFHNHQIRHTLEIVPLRPIKINEEVTVSYIDTNMPRHRRQAELEERYFFGCQCQRCCSEDDEESLLWSTFNADEREIDSAPDCWQFSDKIEQQAVDLLESATHDDSVTGPINKLKYGLHILTTEKQWPLVRYPAPALRQQLVVALLNAQQFHQAFVHAAIQYRRIDHKLMPEEHHPIRMVHAWLLLRIIDHIQGHKQWASQQNEIFHKDIKFGQLRAYMVRDLHVKNGKGGGSSTLGDFIDQKYRQVGASWIRDLNEREAFDRAIWEPVEQLCDEALKQEKTWGTSK